MRGGLREGCGGDPREPFWKCLPSTETQATGKETLASEPTVVTLSVGNDATRRLLTSGVSLLAAETTVLGVASSAGGETAFHLTTAQSSVDVKHLLPIFLELIIPYPWCLCLTALHCSKELQEHPEAVIPSQCLRVSSGKARESSRMETTSSQHQEFFEFSARLGHVLASPWVFLWISECCQLAGLRVPR